MPANVLTLLKQTSIFSTGCVFRLGHLGNEKQLLTPVGVNNLLPPVCLVKSRWRLFFLGQAGCFALTVCWNWTELIFSLPVNCSLQHWWQQQSMMDPPHAQQQDRCSFPQIRCPLLQFYCKRRYTNKPELNWIVYKSNYMDLTLARITLTSLL